MPPKPTMPVKPVPPTVLATIKPVPPTRPIEPVKPTPDQYPNKKVPETSAKSIAGVLTIIIIASSVLYLRMRRK